MHRQESLQRRSTTIPADLQHLAINVLFVDCYPVAESLAYVKSRRVWKKIEFNRERRLQNETKHHISQKTVT